MTDQNITFLDFIKLCFNTIYPENEFYKSWHIKVIADLLEGAMLGKVTRILINMPPRSMKSICVSVAWPAWILGLKPESKIMVASYSRILSEKLSLDTRYIIQSPWYKKIFPHVEIVKDQNTKFKFQTTRMGYRFATSVGGSITGEGGNILIVDDPLNPMQANSERFRQRARDWFDQTFITRLNNRKTGVVVVVMHRLHSEDLSEHLLSKPKKIWHHLCLPMISEKPEKIYSIVDNKLLYSREVNELLYKTEEEEEEVESIDNIKIDLGSYGFAAQYQQNPVNLTGGIINPEWFQRYNFLSEEIKNLGLIVQSWDTANNDNLNSDFSVCTTWIHHQNYSYLLDVFREKLNYPNLKTEVLNLSKRWGPHSILIENKSSGIQIIQELKNIPIISIVPHLNKLARFYHVIPRIESGSVYLPKNSNCWISDFEQEIMNFPRVKHDDQVDSFTQYLQWINNKSFDNIQIRSFD